MSENIITDQLATIRDLTKDHPEIRKRSWEDNVKQFSRIFFDKYRNNTDYNTRREKIKEMLINSVIIKKENIDWKREVEHAGQQGIDIELTDEYMEAKHQIYRNEQIEKLDEWLNYLQSDDSNYIPNTLKIWVLMEVVKIGAYNPEEQKFNIRHPNTTAPFVDLNTEVVSDIIEKISSVYTPEYIELIRNRDDLERDIKKTEKDLNSIKHKINTYIILTSGVENEKAKLRDKNAIQIDYIDIDGKNKKQIFNSLEYKSRREELTKNITPENNLETLKIKHLEMLNDLEKLKENLREKTAEIQALENNAEGEEDIQQQRQRINFREVYSDYDRKKKKSRDELLKETDGMWIQYNQGDYQLDDEESDLHRLTKSLQDQHTGWCTAGKNTAQYQLKGGDFFVFYTRDQSGKFTIPRIAIRMKKLGGVNEIAEIRGIGEGQNLDEEIGKTEILNEKLKEDYFGSMGEKYKKRDNDMKILTAIEKKMEKKGELTIDDLRFLYEIDSKIEGFGYSRDPRIDDIISKRNKREDIILITGYKQDEISLDRNEALNGNIKYHYGDLVLSDLEEAKNVTFPESIGGSLRLPKCKKAENVKFPKKIGGSLELWYLEEAKNVTFPESIGDRNLRLHKCKKAENVVFPKSIGGSLELWYLEEAKNVTFPESIGDRSLYLSKLEKAENVVFPKSIGGSLELWSLEEAKNVTFPESMDRLNLHKLKIAENVVFPKKIGGSFSLWNLEEAKNVTFPESMDRLDLHKCKKAENVTFPEKIKGILDLSKLEEAKNIILPKTYINGRIILSELLDSADGLIFRYGFGGYPQTIIGGRYIYEGLDHDGPELPHKGSVIINGASDKVLKSLKQRYQNITFLLNK